MNDDSEKLNETLQRFAHALKSPPPADLPENFADRIVATALRRRGWRSRGWAHILVGVFSRLFQPRPITIRPAWQLAFALALCVVSSLATMGITGLIAPQSGASSTVWVRFAVKAPHAHRVSLAGDFNGWNADEIRLQDPEGNGVWQALVPLRPGVYQYMFVLDGEQWISDPLGDKTVDDGFGQRNSLVKVQGWKPATREGAHAL